MPHLDNEIAIGFLAGGLARRMGGAIKPLIVIGDKMILEWQLQAIGAYPTKFINANKHSEMFADFGLPIIPDVIDGFAGPLAGILTCLDYMAAHHPKTPYLLSLATDAPFIPAHLPSRLFTALQGEGACIAQAMSCGRRHPVFALWPVAIRSALRTALLDEGVRKIDDFTCRYHTIAVDFTEDFTGESTEDFDPFMNINHKEDIDKAQAFLTSHPGVFAGHPK